MPGSSQSIAGINIILNTIVADQVQEFADILEKAEEKNEAIKGIISDVMKKHGRIIFNGNNYSDEWVEEAGKRGLLNLKSTMDALPYFESDENIALFERQKVLSETEVRSRTEILIEEYCKLKNIEAMTMLDMAKREILPAVSKYEKHLAETAVKLQEVGVKNASKVKLIEKLADLYEDATCQIEALDTTMAKAKELGTGTKAGCYYRDTVVPAMATLRKTCDEMELNTAEKYWPLPSYGDILYSVTD